MAGIFFYETKDHIDLGGCFQQLAEDRVMCGGTDSDRWNQVLQVVPSERKLRENYKVSALIGCLLDRSNMFLQVILDMTLFAILSRV